MYFDRETESRTKQSENIRSPDTDPNGWRNSQEDTLMKGLQTLVGRGVGGSIPSISIAKVLKRQVMEITIAQETQDSPSQSESKILP